MSRLRKRVVPFWWSTITASFVQGTASTISLATFLTNTGGLPITYAVGTGSLPSGVTLSTAGVLSYNGTGAVASSTVQFRASSGVHVADSSSTSVGIAAYVPTNRAPVWSGTTSLGSYSNGSAQSIPLAAYASDPDADPLTFTRQGGTAPAGVTVNASTGVLTIPLGTTAGSYTVIVRASDASLYADRTFSVTISAAIAYTPEVNADFETGSGAPAWFDSYTGGSTTTEQAYSGTKSLKCSVTSGAEDLAWLAGRPTNRLGQGDEIWVRFRTYFPVGYSFSAGPHLKFLRIDSGTPALGGHQQHIDWYIRPGGVGANSTAVGVFDFIQEGVQAWLYDTDAVPTGIVRGQWQTWNFYYKLHATAASARIRLWRDSTLLVDTNARATLGASANVVGCKTDANAQGIMLMTYWNGGAPATQSFYVDDFTVATSASPPTATDSGGRIWIGV